MRRHKLLNLLQANRKAGEFRAEGNTIFLYDVIVGSEAEAEFWGGVAPETFVRQLASMTGPVSLRINSPGGEVFAARAMQQAMVEYGDEITVHVDGLAASAATFLAVSGTRCIMAPGAFLMIHNAATLAMGTAADMRQVANVLEKVDGSIAATYAAKAGQDAASFATLMTAETWLTAEEAVELGLADEIAPAGGPKAKAWDLTAYQHAPGADPIRPPAPLAELARAIAEPDPAEIEADAERDRLAQSAARTRQLMARLLSPTA
jgi:ATP-dependent Clp protease protease subunit